MNARILAALIFLACSPAEPSFSESVIAPVDQLSRIIAPGGTNRVDIILVGAGGQPNIFMQGSGGGYIHLRNVPLSRKDTLIVYAARALPRGVGGWYRARESFVYIPVIGGARVEAGTAWGEPGAVLFDPQLQQYITAWGKGESATSERGGCSYLGFGCGADLLKNSDDAHIEVTFYEQ